MKFRIKLLAVLLAAAVAWSPARVAAQGQAPQDLVRFLPNEVNTLALYNVARIMMSDRARREGWTKISQLEYLAGAVPVNPSIVRILVGSEFTAGRNFKGSSHSVVPIVRQIDMEALAKMRGGEVIEVAGEKAATTENGHIIIKLGDQLLGAVSSGSKQDAARWLKYTKTAMVSRQSRYLFNAINGQGGTADIVLAMDLEDFFNGAKAGRMAAASPVLQQNGAAQAEISAFISGLRGIRFFAIIDAAGTRCAFHLDSNVGITRTSPELFRAFIEEFIGSFGGHLTALSTATVRFSGNSAELRFPITDSDLALITSFAMPQDHGITEENTIAVNRNEVSGEATLRYFRAVNIILGQIRPVTNPSNIKADESAEYKRTALWHDQAANRIMNISTLNVDKDMVAYGQGMAARLNAIADSLRGVVNKFDWLAPQSYAFSYGNRRWGNVDTNWGQLTAEMSKTAANDVATREKLWEQMANLRVQIAGEMRARFNLDFPPR